MSSDISRYTHIVWWSYGPKPYTLSPKPRRMGLNPYKPQHECGWLSNYGPFLGALNIRCRIIIGIKKRDHNFDNHPCECNPRNLFDGLTLGRPFCRIPGLEEVLAAQCRSCYGYCPHPVTVYIRGPIIYNHIMIIIQLLLRGGSTQQLLLCIAIKSQLFASKSKDL